MFVSSFSQTGAVKASVGETTASKENAKSTTEAPAKEAEPRQAEASKEASSEVTTRSRAEEPKLNTHRVMLPVVSLNEPLITCVIQQFNTVQRKAFFFFQFFL